MFYDHALVAGAQRSKVVTITVEFDDRGQVSSIESASNQHRISIEAASNQHRSSIESASKQQRYMITSASGRGATIAPAGRRDMSMPSPTAGPKYRIRAERPLYGLPRGLRGQISGPWTPLLARLQSAFSLSRARAVVVVVVVCTSPSTSPLSPLPLGAANSELIRS